MVYIMFFLLILIKKVFIIKVTAKEISFACNLQREREREREREIIRVSLDMGKDRLILVKNFLNKKQQK